ncbi:Globin-like protein [Pseudocohnilembus persalinus]|uniref:Globin-like protein n=1 Tax=Pseudocohnilembus persalinus TaxID=266149 RepID=A0A0V0QPT3_PSEPJ|nr:Globin-like protein [Pseudocohnilembus persalinus]|eukprot:KRX04177.1 Globin-like protein [Pseudocohnilembus persalinus]
MEDNSQVNKHHHKTKLSKGQYFSKNNNLQSTHQEQYQQKNLEKNNYLTGINNSQIRSTSYQPSNNQEYQQQQQQNFNGKKNQFLISTQYKTATNSRNVSYNNSAMNSNQQSTSKLNNIDISLNKNDLENTSSNKNEKSGKKPVINVQSIQAKYFETNKKSSNFQDNGPSPISKIDFVQEQIQNKQQEDSQKQQNYTNYQSNYINYQPQTGLNYQYQHNKQNNNNNYNNSQQYQSGNQHTINKLDSGYKDNQHNDLARQFNEYKNKTNLMKNDYENKIKELQILVKDLQLSVKQGQEIQKQLQKDNEKLRNQNSLLEQSQYQSQKQIQKYQNIEQIHQSNLKIHENSYYNRIGKTTLDKIIDNFYDTVMIDSELGPFFKNVNTKNLRKSQKCFFGLILGGPENYDGKDMFTAHKHLGITIQQFEQMGNLLVKAFNDYNIDHDIVQEIKLQWNKQKPFIISQNVSLFEQLGGETIVNQIVDRFYDLLLVEPKVKHFFKHTDIVNLRKQQKCFLTQVFGGPQIYKGRDMFSIHQQFNITDQDFDIVGGVLIHVLKEYKIEQYLLQEITEIWESQRNYIVALNNASQEKTILEQIGGQKNLDIAVDMFYDRLLKDQKISHYFKNTNMIHQRQQQKDFLLGALGGPQKYNGMDMYTAHKNLNINKKDFDYTGLIFLNVLKDLGIKQDLINQIGDIWNSLLDQVVQENQQKQSDRQQNLYKQNEESQKTLYERIGGQDAVNTAVDIFYQKLLKDPQLSKYFKNTNMQQQVKQQKHFLTQVFGGPSVYQGRNMYDAHKNLGIFSTDFDNTGKILINTLKELNVQQKEVQEVEGLWNSLKDEIVVKKQTIFERLGGQESINIAVDKFYDNLLINPQLSKYFKNTDMARQRKQQKCFLTEVFGGPQKYNGMNMYDAHKFLNISKNDFDQTGLVLLNVLKDLGVQADLIQEIGDIWNSLEDQIVIQKTQEKQQSQVQNYKQIPLIDRIGGQDALNIAVDLFYDNLLQDQQVSKYFKNTDMEKQRKQQKHFLTQVFGGPQLYNGLSMYEAHKNLGINSKDFQKTGEILINALKSLKVGKTEVDEIQALWNSLENDVVFENKSNISQQTLFQRIGGQDAINAATDIFYDRLLVDPVLSKYFKNTDMNLQRYQQKCFLGQVFGGPQNYQGRDMYSAHKNLGINGDDFNRTGQLLLSVLKELGVSQDIVNEVQAIWDSQYDDIVTINSKSANKISKKFASNSVNKNVQNQQPQTLYEKLGGKAAIELAVDQFYDILINDSKISHYFKNTNMQVQRIQQKCFLTEAFGGPSEYKGRDMFTAHKYLNINNQDFTYTGQLLLDVLKNLNVAQNLIQEVGEIWESLRVQIVQNNQSNQQQENGLNNQKSEQNRYQPSSELKNSNTIYDRIGGKNKLDQITNLLFNRVQKEEKIGGFFKTIDLERQKKQLSDFLSSIFGGSEKYHGRDIKTAHQYLNINDDQFNCFGGLLIGVLHELQINQEDIGQITKFWESMRQNVVKSQDLQHNDEYQKPKEPLITRIGGQNQLYQAVDTFYDKVLQDTRVNFFFKNTDMGHLRQQQKYFFELVMGGQNKYNGKNMLEAHQNLGINDYHFDVVVDILLKTLIEFGVAKDEIKEINQILENVRSDISQVPNDSQTLYQKIGKTSAIEIAINKFFLKINVDKTFKNYFNEEQISQIKQSLKEYIVALSGGSIEIDIFQIYKTFAGVNLNLEQFTELGNIFFLVFADFGIGAELENQIKDLWQNLSQLMLEEYPSLIQRVGQQRLDGAIDIFYDRCQVHPQLYQFFSNFDTSYLRQHQKDYMTQLFGGPNNFKGRSVNEAHQNIYITPQDFKIMGDIYIQTLKDLGVEQLDLQEILVVFNSLKNEVGVI